ncbi:hypothetical protein BE18_41245 [Sorangium cellulosum]|uniref:Uncharacterized protein n=1 Tax=Sorangium cellulosum TaxID=56 RepID=A0A150RT44_SORCE|nr:hypothetical protein BE18_41245 [Sorangium cellulosum]
MGQRVLDAPEDEGERGAELVAHVGHELRLEAVERRELVPVPGDLPLEPPLLGDVAPLGDHEDDVALPVLDGLQVEVDRDDLLAPVAPEDLHVVPDELAARRVPHRVLQPLLGLGRALPPAAVPERHSVHLPEPHAGAADRGVVRLPVRAAGVEQAPELEGAVHRDPRREQPHQPGLAPWARARELLLQELGVLEEAFLGVVYGSHDREVFQAFDEVAPFRSFLAAPLFHPVAHPACGSAPRREQLIVSA